MPFLNGTYINKTSGILGGKARINGTRIPVWLIVSLYESGMDYDEIIADYPRIGEDDIDAALRYYEDNRDEIWQDIEDNS